MDRSSNQIIRVSDLSKCYRIGLSLKNHPTIREAIMDRVKNPIRNLAGLKKLARFGLGRSPDDQEDIIWALKNLSLEVNEGEVLGIIGRNGAGKTTLLKILSRITEPTSGEVEIHGRLASLLEVGTGFHPELTGRENIFLNGAILGMHRKEIKEKFGEIIRFAEIEKFIDTPIKHYSSGMYVRLAFAVAAHLEPEILLVDEVLAVGDIAFQEKCLGKMQGIAKGGRTVLFISHNMGAIRSLCQNAIWLDNGQIVKKGPANEVVRDYEEQQLNRFHESTYVIKRGPEEIKKLKFYVSRVEMLNAQGEHNTMFRYGENIILIVDFDGEILEGNFSPEFRIYNELGQLVSTGAAGPYHGIYFSHKVKRVKIEIGPLILTSGKYKISFSIMTGGTRSDTWDSAIGFTLVECQPFAKSWEIATYAEGACVIGQSFSEVK
ncbi:MAG: ABC transporter ATP-binding protein [bacterium]|nr:ABC transporter ATP-binding protein [bacterium]